MQTLEASESGTDIHKSTIYNLLKLSFQSQKMQKILASQQGGKIKVIYQSELLLPKVRSFIGVHWACKVTDQLIFIDLKLNSTCSHSFKLCQFLRSQSEIQQFIHLINNLNLCNSEGYFYFKEDTGQLILRQKITNHLFLSSQTVIIKYFIRCIKKISKIFLQEIQQIIFYYRLPGISLSQAQKFFQQKNQVPLLQQTQNIIWLKKCFQAQRQKKQNSSKQMIKLNENIVVPCTQLLLTTNPVNPPTQRQEGKIDTYYNIYKYEIDTLMKDITHRKKKETTHIVTGFKIKEVVNEMSMGQGGFSQIFFGIYHYLPQISIYANSQPLQLAQMNEQQGIVINGLIKKTSNTKKGERNISIQNQCNFLLYIRNKVCPYIAQYFCKCQISQPPFSNNQIYLDYYPDNLASLREKQDRKLKIMQDVCMALLFLHDQKILHRDLKQRNIMIDRYHRAKLIDFGSVANMKGSHNFTEKDNIVRSTQGYFRTYRQALIDFPRLKDFMNKDDYYSHQTFDLYSFGVILQKQFYLNQFTSQNHFIRNNIKYLSDKCKESNPQDRWTIQQVTIFLRHIMIFYQLRKEFWNWGFDSRFKAHQLGKYYNGNGAYNLRVKKQVFPLRKQQLVS